MNHVHSSTVGIQNSISREATPFEDEQKCERTIWRTFIKSSPLIYLLLFFAVVAFNYAHFTYRRPVPRTPYLTGFDDLGYFVYARSLFFDRDLDFRNDYEFFVRLLGEDLAGPPFAEWLKARNSGPPPNHFNIGVGLAALPWLALFHFFAQLLTLAQILPTMPSPSAPWYAFAFIVGNIAYGTLGLWLMLRSLDKFFPRPTAQLAVLSTIAAGPALFYFLYQPGMSHLTSLGCVAAAVTTTLAWENERAPLRRNLFAALWGLVVGLALSVRTVNLPLVLLASLPLSQACAKVQSHGQHWQSSVLSESALAAAGVLLGFAPQLLAWHALYGSWLANPYEYKASLLPPHFLSVLFGRRHGLFFWHPWLLICALGLAFFYRRCPRWGLVSLAIILATAWIYGNWHVYWLGASFGMRGFIELAPFFALGAGQFLHWLGEHTRSRFVPLGLILIFSMLNLHLMISFRGGVITVDGPLYWFDTISEGRKYKAQLRRECTILATWRHGFAVGERATLWENPI